MDSRWNTIACGCALYSSDGRRSSATSAMHGRSETPGYASSSLNVEEVVLGTLNEDERRWRNRHTWRQIPDPMDPPARHEHDLPLHRGEVEPRATFNVQEPLDLLLA